MKAISLWEPWAILIALLAKQYETRSWATSYRGPLIIHAAKRFTVEERAICLQSPFRQVLDAAGYRDIFTLPLGAALCMVDLVDVIPTKTIDLERRISSQEWSFGNYTWGRFAWKLENVRVFKQPIPCRGYQGLWNWPLSEAETLAKLEVKVG
jgi:hypothetical protein